MKLKIITAVSNPEHPGIKKLEHSLKLGNYDYKILSNSSVDWNWGGWGALRQWLGSEEANNYTHVIWSDGFDTLALAPQTETETVLKELLEPNPNAFIYGVEKHWFPHEGTDVAPKNFTEYQALFTERVKGLPPKHHWRHANGGQFAGTIQTVRDWYDQAPKHRNNQAWANAFYSEDTQNKLILDFDCRLFQTLSHSGIHHGSPEEFSIFDGRLTNNHTNSKPCFVHANGIKHPTELQTMYNILNL